MPVIEIEAPTMMSVAQKEREHVLSIRHKPPSDRAFGDAKI